MNLDFLNLCELYPQLKNKHSLIAVSGGVDSVLLSHLFSESKLNFSIAHCNFGLRGKESDKDFILVRKLAKSFDDLINRSSVSLPTNRKTRKNIKPIIRIKTHSGSKNKSKKQINDYKKRNRKRQTKKKVSRK